MKINNIVLVALVCTMCAAGDVLALRGLPPVGCGLDGIALLYPLVLPWQHRTMQVQDTRRAVAVAVTVILSTAALGLLASRPQTFGLYATAAAILGPKWVLVAQSFWLYVVPALEEARRKSSALRADTHGGV